MLHNGSLKDNISFKTICPLKQKEQSTIITYENNNGITIYHSSGELLMEEYWYYSINAALLGVDKYSRICHNWEIYKLLFILHNVNPVWKEVNMTTDWDKVVCLCCV